jgi:hypothetical protein
MSDEERARILRMVAEGTISPEEATDLLEAVADEPQAELVSRPQQRIMAPMTAGKRLVIEISEGGDSHVNLRIPLGLARMAGRFVPRQAARHLSEHGIELDELMVDMGQPSNMDGTILEIHEGDGHVRIAVE